MSTSIAIGIASKDPEAAYQRIESAAAEHGYAIERGVESAEADCRMGLNDIVSGFDLTAIAILKAPSTHAAPLAPGIQEELLKWELEGRHVGFFEFLRAVGRSLRGLGSALVVSFAAEWGAGDRVRLSEGSIEELVEKLKRPGNWYMRLYLPQSGRWQDSDEVPLVYVADL